MPDYVNVALNELLSAPDDRDRQSVAAFARQARRFLANKEWCSGIESGHCACGWNGILAVFWFRIEPSNSTVDSSVWVVAGDVPPAYICSENQSAAEVLDSYATEMERWASAVSAAQSVAGLIPVNVAPTVEHAKMLQSRVSFIRQHLIPELRNE